VQHDFDEKLTFDKNIFAAPRSSRRSADRIHRGPRAVAAVLRAPKRAVR
jgi:hypothetical protein